jgi:hypothetical protein
MTFHNPFTELTMAGNPTRLFFVVRELRMVPVAHFRLFTRQLRYNGAEEGRCR